MAITRRWQAGAEVDTTNSHNIEFDAVNSNWTTSNTYARSGTYSFQYVDGNDWASIGIAATRQVRVGFHWYPDETADGINGQIFSITQASIVSQLAILRVHLPTTLELWVAGSARDTEVGAFSADRWHHIGMDAYIDNAAGWVKVYLDGTEILTFAGNTGNANIENVLFGYNSSNHPIDNMYYDDLYIDDTTGEAAAPVPDLRFEFISPNGVGNYSVWDPFPGTGEANWQDVDERPNDGDTTYVEAQVLNERDSYAMTTYTMPAGWAIEAVIPTAIAKKTDGGTDTELNLMTRQGGVDDDGADQDLPTSYGLLWDRFTTDPGGGSWSQADLDSIECGVRGRGTF